MVVYWFGDENSRNHEKSRDVGPAIHTQKLSSFVDHCKTYWYTPRAYVSREMEAWHQKLMNMSFFSHKSMRFVFFFASHTWVVLYIFSNTRGLSLPVCMFYVPSLPAPVPFLLVSAWYCLPRDKPSTNNATFLPSRRPILQTQKNQATHTSFSLTANDGVFLLVVRL